MKNQGRLEIVLRFLRAAVLIDAGLALVVGLVSLALGLRTFEAYGTLLIWAGSVIILLACVIGIGGISARVEDAAAYSISGMRNEGDLFRQIAEAGQSSFGCFLILVMAGIGLLAIGYLLQIVHPLIR